MVNNELSARVRADYSRARFKAFLNGVVAALSGRSNELLSYEEVKEKLHIGGPIYRGVQTIPIRQVVGSLNRYQQFDRAFMPKRDDTAKRWQQIDRVFYQDGSLPPVVLYKVGQIYFVVDGHHRVSVARKQGQEYIEAEVRECSTRVNVTPDLNPEDLEILGEKVEFLERTGLDRIRPEAKVKITVPDGFSRMLEHIAVHRYFMGLEMQHDVSEDEAVAHWYDTVYSPIISVIRESEILKEFPGKTEADLYLWVLDRQHSLAEKGNPLQPPDQAAREFVEDTEP